MDSKFLPVKDIPCKKGNILFGAEVECKLAVIFITAEKIKKNDTNT